MYEELLQLYNDLGKIRTYLIKIGPIRRKGDIVLKKLKEADNLLFIFNENLERLRLLKTGFENEEFHKFDKLNKDFLSLYDNILDLCSNSSSTKESILELKMAKFELKIALSLLPVLNDGGTNTKQLIDGIEYYQTELDSEGQTKLVNFVLKSRLLQSAKLKLNTKYDSVNELIKAMKTNLLPKKSATALQQRLFNLKQNDLSIDDYGKQITDLFVDLTISQSEGNESNFGILKPINEKLAIKSFADGLRNRRLSTIITARQFTSLSEAIQSAIDEDVSTVTTSGDILYMRRNNSSQQYRNYRGHWVSRGRGQTPPPADQRGDRSWPTTRGGWRSRGRGSSNRGARGRIFFNQANNQEQQHMHILTDTKSPENQSENNNDNIEQFFRE
ncbi:hypothetical protein HF086_016034 [Spodoptera exigua]|uniref:Retrotransposon gag domain-containing protein n=1 Tax=Spodoptera exigua TaxID=7107 RepID=A0A922MNZ1_SPOEX|nr:hypothetical protein HF086_016034 [Spodoptera exigua]